MFRSLPETFGRIEVMELDWLSSSKPIRLVIPKPLTEFKLCARLFFWAVCLTAPSMAMQVQRALALRAVVGIRASARRFLGGAWQALLFWLSVLGEVGGSWVRFGTLFELRGSANSAQLCVWLLAPHADNLQEQEC